MTLLNNCVLYRKGNIQCVFQDATMGYICNNSLNPFEVSCIKEKVLNDEISEQNRNLKYSGNQLISKRNAYSM